MASFVEWLDSTIDSIEFTLINFWQALVLEERKHPIILALALIIVLSVILTLTCNCLCWVLYLCYPKQRHPGLIMVPQNYGTIPQTLSPDGKNQTFHQQPNAPPNQQPYSPVPSGQVYQQVPAAQPLASTSAQYPVLSV